MENNLTTRQLEEKIEFGKCTSIFIGEFQFIIYVDYNINGGNKSYIFIHQDSVFNDVLDFQKQYNNTESLEKDIRKQLKQLEKRITKSLKKI